MNDHTAAWGSTSDDVAREHLDDVITGWPDHYIVNGDPTSCGCPEHRHLSDAFMQQLEAKETAVALSVEQNPLGEGA